jgi:predicted Zn-dependent peptidase
MKSTLGLMDDMPESEITFDAAKNSLLNQIQTTRTTKTSILFDYLNAKKRGLDYDIRKDVYGQVPGFSLKDIKEFQEKNVKGRTHTILVLGDKDKIDMKILEKYGKVKTLTLEEVFGY